MVVIWCSASTSNLVVHQLLLINTRLGLCNSWCEPSTLDILDEQTDRLPLPARWSLAGARVVPTRHYALLTRHRATAFEDNSISPAADRYLLANKEGGSNITGAPSYCHRYFLNFVAVCTSATPSLHSPYGSNFANSYLRSTCPARPSTICSTKSTSFHRRRQ